MSNTSDMFGVEPHQPSSGGGGGSPTGPAGGDLGSTYPNPSVVGLRTKPIDAAAPSNGDVYQFDGTKWKAVSVGSLLNNFLTHPITEIWVGAPLNPAVTPTGSAIAPFTTYADAMTYIAGRAEEYFKVNIAPEMTGDITIPANKGILFECSTINGATVGDVIINGSVDDKHQIFFVGIASIDTVDFVGPAISVGIFAVHRFGNMTSTITNTGGINAIVVGNGVFEESSQITYVTFQSINLGPTGVVIGANVDFQGNITTGVASIIDSNIPAILNIYDTNLNLNEVDFNAASVISFLGGAGVVHADAYTAKQFDAAGASIVNGVLSRDEDLEESKLTFVTTPTLEGQIYAYVANSTVDLAYATATVLCEAICGVWNNHQGFLQGTEGRVYPIRIEPNLIPNPTDPIYISKLVPGLGTTTIPTVSGDNLKIVAYIKDTLMYNPLDPTGSVVLAKLNIQPLMVVP